jgi:YbbR domain-containing protein
VWITAVTAEDPTIERTINTPIPIIYLAPDEGLQLVGNPPREALVTIRAPESVWNEISPQSVLIEIELQGLGAGIHSIDLEAFLDLESYAVKSIQPSRAIIKLEPLLTQDFPVRVKLIGDAAIGYNAEEASATPRIVTISGPTSLVTDIVELRAEVNIVGTSQNFELEVELVAYDENDQPIEGIEISPDTATVFVTVEQGDRYKLVSVIAETAGIPAYGYRTTGIVVNPDEILVTSSDPEAFDNLAGFITTETIDLSGATETIEFNAILQLPEGIVPIQTQTVLVTVTIEPIITSISLDITVEVQNLEPGLAAQPSPDTVKVIIEGPLAILEGILPEDVRVILNMLDYELGSYEDLIPEVIVSGSEIEVEIIPPTINVDVIVAPPATPTPIP